MAVIYVKEQGALVQKSGERIVISKGTNTLLEAPGADLCGTIPRKLSGGAHCTATECPKYL